MLYTFSNTQKEKSNNVKYFLFYRSCSVYKAKFHYFVQIYREKTESRYDVE